MESITLYLQGLHDLSFWTLQPLSTLSTFIQRWRTSSIGVIQGQSESGKSFLAQKLSEYFLVRSNESIKSSNVFIFHAEKDNLPELITNMKRRLITSKIIIIKHIHLYDFREFYSGIVREANPESNQFILCTTNVSVKNFNYEDDLPILNINPNLVGYILRRRSLNLETSTQLSNTRMSAAIRWMDGLYNHLNSFTNFVLSPKVFISCPLNNTHILRTWIIDLWNNELVRVLRKYSGSEDPVNYLVKTWPWKDDVRGLPRAVCPVFIRAKHYEVKSPDESQDQDPLVNFYNITYKTKIMEIQSLQNKICLAMSVNYYYYFVKKNFCTPGTKVFFMK